MLLVHCHGEQERVDSAWRLPDDLLEPGRRGRRRRRAEAGEALAELCDAYWFPLYAFIRRKGNGAERALDLTQGYFARLLERRTVAAADPARGRFRSFLLADCSHFLAHERERDGAARRGGGLRRAVDRCA